MIQAIKKAGKEYQTKADSLTECSGKRCEFTKGQVSEYFKQNLRDKRHTNTSVQSAEKFLSVFA